MKTYLNQINNWESQDLRYVVATVVKTWGSAPRSVGSKMLINEKQEILGSVSGGCVEGAVVKAAMEVLKGGASQMLDFGVSDEDAWAVGLSCGGKISVWITPSWNEKDSDLWQSLKSEWAADRSCILLEPINMKKQVLQLISFDQQSKSDIEKRALQLLEDRKAQILETESGQFFCHLYPRKEHIIIIGAAHISADLIALAKDFNFKTTVIDPRGFFLNSIQYPVDPDEKHECYPSEVLEDFRLDPFSHAVILSHDPKIDDDALRILLKSNVRYIGALGSRKTHEKRKNRLTSYGFTEDEISRIYAPIGEPINAKSAREIALCIMAQIIRVKNQSK